MKLWLLVPKNLILFPDLLWLFWKTQDGKKNIKINLRYEIVQDSGEDFYWGRNEGCKFLDIDCTNTFDNEYCNDKYFNCSDENQFKTRCHKSMFSNGCKISFVYQSCMNTGLYGNFFETFGNTSVCLKIKVFKIII